jgi:hypothetical protein
MSLVIQQPHTATNPTEKYRVVDFEGWIDYVNGATTSYAFTAFDSYDKALEAKKAAER